MEFFKIILLIFGLFYPKLDKKFKKFSILILHTIKFVVILLISRPSELLSNILGDFMREFLHFSLITSHLLLILKSPSKCEISNQILRLNVVQIALILIFSAVAIKFEETPILALSDIAIKIHCIHYASIVKILTENFSQLRIDLKQSIKSNDEFKAFIYDCQYFVINYNQVDEIFEGKMAKLMKSYNEVMTKVRKLNKTFGFCMLLSLWTLFLSIMSNGYDFFIEIETTRRIDVIFGEKIGKFF